MIVDHAIPVGDRKRQPFTATVYEGLGVVLKSLAIIFVPSKRTTMCNTCFLPSCPFVVPSVCSIVLRRVVLVDG